MTDAETLVDALDSAGYRLTAPRRAVAELVAERDGPFTAAELVAAARAQKLGVGRATIFRALDLLEELDLVERLDLPTGDHAYVGCAPRHHHHVVCSSCGRTTDVPDCGMSAVAAEIRRRTGFEIETHRLELFGVCPACRTTRPPAH